MKVHAPLMSLSKADIAREAQRLGVELASVSCYRADINGRACGHCDACHLRAEGFREAGIDDPTGTDSVRKRLRSAAAIKIGRGQASWLQCPRADLELSRGKPGLPVALSAIRFRDGPLAQR